MPAFRTDRFVQGSGFALVIAGALIDAAYHLWWSGDVHHAGLGLLGHLVTLAGMVVTIGAVVATGIRSSARSEKKGELHAGHNASAS
jgi:hypothetical protein